MFRCISDLRGLAIDVDSIPNISMEILERLENSYECIFLVENEKTYNWLSQEFNSRKVVKFSRLFAPNYIIHKGVLSAASLKNSEMVYVSGSHDFIVHANEFLSGTIWITDSVSYEQASNAADLIINSIEKLPDALDNSAYGFFGEIKLYPIKGKKGTIVPVRFDFENTDIPMYMLGRYFGSNHYMKWMHPYSVAISSNKRIGKPYYGIFNNVFSYLFCKVIEQIKNDYEITSVCSVPVKPGKQPRFNSIVNEISLKCELENISKAFKCIKNYSDQKGLSAEERAYNIRDAFTFSGDLNGKTVVLIDDVVTTGATLRECIRVLIGSGASVVVVVLAVNQMGKYWSFISPAVTCPVCNSKMSLLVSRNRDYFFNCNSCYNNEHSISTSIDYAIGYKTIQEEENKKYPQDNSIRELFADEDK